MTYVDLVRYSIVCKMFAMNYNYLRSGLRDIEKPLHNKPFLI